MADTLLLLMASSGIVGGGLVGIVALAKTRPSAEFMIAVAVAAADAKRRRHGELQPAHFLLAALWDPVIRTQADPSLGEKLERELAALPETGAELVNTHALAEAMNAARKRASRRPPFRRKITLADAVEACAARKGIQWRGSGAASAAAAPPDYRGHAVDALADVVFWNDRKTKMETVISILTSCFAISESQALYLTFTVHTRGAAVVGTFTGQEAHERTKRAIAIARAENAPLRITVQSTNTSIERRWWRWGRGPTSPAE